MQKAVLDDLFRGSEKVEVYVENNAKILDLFTARVIDLVKYVLY
jgi:hypothetical protein